MRFSPVSFQLRIWDSSFSIATMLHVRKSGLRIPAGERDIYYLQNIQMFLEPTQPVISKVYQGLQTLHVKLPGSEINHTPSSRAQVRNEWSYISISSICLKSSALHLHLTYAMLGPDIFLSALFSINYICVPLMISQTQLNTYLEHKAEKIILETNM